MRLSDPRDESGPATLTQAIVDAAERHADAPYLVAFDEQARRRVWTYAEFYRGATRLAGWLRAQGMRPGDRIATVSENRAEVLLAYFACWLGGMTACPINVAEPSRRKAHILEAAQCRLALVEEPYRAEMASIAEAAEGTIRVNPIESVAHPTGPAAEPDLRAVPGEAGAFLVFTSGTTGHPKGVLLDHENLRTNALATADWHRLQPGDGVMTVLPIHHVNGAIVTGLAPFLAGGRNILNRRFSARSFWARMAEERAALSSMVPTLLEYLLAADEDVSAHDLSGLRYLLCGAGPLLVETVTRFEDRFGVGVCHGFGMSETTAYNTQFPMELPATERRAWYVKHGFPSVGCPIACNDVTVLRADGTEADPLERGQIAIRGPTVMQGYLDDPEANARSFLGAWFLSGDQGFFDQDDGGRRFFFVSGRLKELIVRGGENIAPLEIDEALRRQPGVRFALAVPFEHALYGEEVAAYVVPDPGVTLDSEALAAAVRADLPFARTPKVIVIGDEVPFTTTGKPMRVALAARLAPELRAYRDRSFREARDI